MNISLSDQEKILCKFHKNEYCIAADLNTQGQGDFDLLCIKCLVEQHSNQKITFIEDTKKLISQMKSQKAEKQVKENEARREIFKNILSQLIEFKLLLDLTFDKMTSIIKQRLFYISKDIESIEIEGKSNYFEDLRELSKTYSPEIIDNQNIQDDTKVIDQIQKQLQNLFSAHQYLQLNQTIKNSRSLINEGIDDIIIIQSKKPINSKKTPSLNKTCNVHRKEIIMFELDSNKKIEERFMCVNCMKDNPKKYETIEEINDQWTAFNQEQFKILSNSKTKKVDQSSKLQNQLKEIRKNCNSQLDELEDTLIKEQLESNNQLKQIKKKINSSTIFDLDEKDLLEVMKKLSKLESASALTIGQIEYQTGKDQIFYQDIENKLENLKQQTILDIQQSKNILKQNSNNCDQLIQLKEMITSLIQQPEKDQQKKEILDEINEDLNNFLRNSKQCEYYIDQFKNTLQFYKEYISDIELIRNKLMNLNKKKQIKNHYIELFDDHVKIFKKKFDKIDKFTELEKYREDILVEFGQIKQQEERSLEGKIRDQDTQILESQNESLKSANEIQLLIQQRDSLISQENKLIQLVVNGKQQAEDFEKFKSKFQNLEHNNRQRYDQELQKIQNEFEKLYSIFQQFENLFSKKIKQLYFENQRYAQILTFSSTNKHSDIQITDNGRIVDIGDNQYGYCMCEQVIPQYGKISFAFEILRISNWCNVGIGFKDIIKKNGYQGEGKGKGSYLLGESNSKHFHSSNKTQGKVFEFQVNDVIIIEVSVEQKYIKWINQNSQDYLITEIDTNQELYPCVYMYDSKIRIKDIS